MVTGTPKRGAPQGGKQGRREVITTGLDRLDDSALHGVRLSHIDHHTGGEIMDIDVERLAQLYIWAVASQRGLDRFFEKHPEFAKHEQGSWGQAIKNGHCETAYCLAGQEAVAQGWTFIIEDSDWENHGSRREAKAALMVPTEEVKNLGLRFVKGSGKGFAQGTSEGYMGVIASGVTRYPAAIAAESLGLDEDTANRLFNGSNDVYAIKAIIEDAFADAGLDLRLPAPEDVVV